MIEPSPEDIAAASPVPPKGKISYMPEAHRMLPQSAEAEQGVLGSILIAPIEAIPICFHYQVTAEWFHVPANATIYATLMDMANEGQMFDFITLTNRLRDAGKLESVGGARFITDLFTYVPTASMLKSYIEILSEKWTARKLARLCSEYGLEALDPPEGIVATVASAHEALTALALKRTREEKPIRTLVTETLTQMRDRSEGRIKYIRTGIPKLDLESPCRPGDFVVIAGRRKSGKSALAADIIRHVCMTVGNACAVFSLEMPDWQWIERLLANVGRISLRSISHGNLHKDEQVSVNEAAGTIASSKLHVIDCIHDLAGIVGKMRQLKAQNPDLSLVVVDYCQLVEVPERRGSNREQEVAKVSRQLKLMAGELGIVVIGLSQLNAEGQTRESRALEQDCTALWAVLEDLDKHGQPVKGQEHYRTLYVPFQRGGAPGVRVRLNFIGSQSRFEEEEGEYEEAELPIEGESRNWKKGRKHYD